MTKDSGSLSGRVFGLASAEPEDLARRREERRKQRENDKKTFGTWFYLLNPPEAIVRAARRLNIPTLPDGQIAPGSDGDCEGQAQSSG